MKAKNYLILMASMLVLFVAGCVDVSHTVGKFGIECLTGYGVCSISAAVAFCATMVLFVTRREERHYENKF